MIIRYWVECPECAATILLRVNVGLDLEQPFYFVCRNCGGATRAKQIIWYDPEPGARLELEEGRIVPETSQPDQVLSIHPDLPSLPDARSMAEVDGSPFLMHHRLLGDRFVEFYHRLRSFRGCADADWNNVRRWLAHYVERRWTEFDRLGAQILKEKWEVPANNAQRHHVLHVLLDLMTVPLWVYDHYPAMKQSWYQSWSIGKEVPQEVARSNLDYMRREENRGSIRAVQREVFHCLGLYMENRVRWLPALPAAMYGAQADRSIDELRLFRDDFPALRDIYLATFETCHRALKYVLAPVNIVQRGRLEDFGDGCVGFARFERLPSARKAEFLKNIPAWEARWPCVFDRRVRNAIGHHAARHDLPSGRIVIDETDEVSYLSFLVGVLNLVHGILSVANALKLYGIAASQ